MADRLKGKRAFVTGAGQGIGRASALLMAGEGAEVLATDLSETALATLAAADSRIRIAPMDVTDVAAVEAVSSEAGPINVLFNCAGFVHQGTLLECDEADWDYSFQVNVKGMYRVTRALLPSMLAEAALGRGGSIINMASVASSIKAVRDRCAYSATKGAVIGLTKSIAADYVGDGIRCNAICPGTVRTPSLDERIGALGLRLGDPEAARASLIGRQPMGRFGTPEEIASLVVYLASDELSFVTGTTLVIDGGWSM